MIIMDIITIVALTIIIAIVLITTDIIIKIFHNGKNNYSNNINTMTPG